MAQLQLEGEYLQDDGDLEELKEKISDLQDELRRVRAELQQERLKSQSALAAMANLRSMLSPFHRLLRGVFGEIEVVLGEETDAGQAPSRTNAAPSAKSEVWESWIRKLGGKQAEFIRALAEHGEMTAIQLKIATHSGTSTVSDTCRKLLTLGLLQKNGAKYSLKDI